MRDVTSKNWNDKFSLPAGLSAKISAGLSANFTRLGSDINSVAAFSRKYLQNNKKYI